jgi:ABC-type Fe3+ transport system permease subunit
MRCRPRLWAPLVVAPLFLPSYAAYSGWGLLRSPGTAPANWLAGAPEWVVTLVSEGLAIWGLALWAWPIGALVLVAWIWRIDPALLDVMRLDPIGLRRRLALRGAMLLPGLTRAALIIFLVMLGSAVPLHVAQVDTYAIRIWTDLALHPAPVVLLGSWPLLLIAASVAAIVAWRIDAGGSIARIGGPVRVGRWTHALSALIWAASVIAPAALFLFIGMRNPSTGAYRFEALARFWSELGGAMTDSLLIGLLTGAGGALIALGVWAALDARSRLARATIALLVLGALTPGVLVGSAVQGAYALPVLRPIGESVWAVALAHLARFGLLAALGAWWLARSEPRQLADLRRLEPNPSLARWWLMAHHRSTGGILGIAVLMGVLSFHEIEAAIMALPAGVESYPQRMLQLLHFQREDMLSAGALYGMGLGLLGSIAAALCLGAALRARSPTTAP